MAFHLIGPVKINDNLQAAVTELMRKVPVGANGLVIIVHADGLHDIKGATIKGLPVRFDPLFGNDELTNTVSIGFGIGNLE